jgi:hypothetical protein
MFGLILLGIALISGFGGWLIGRLKRRRWWPPVLWILLPFWLCLLFVIPFGLFYGIDGFITWLTLLGMLGYPILAWAIPAAAVFAVARFGDQAAGNLRTP